MLFLPSFNPAISLLSWFSLIKLQMIINYGFPGGSDGKESACSIGDSGSIPGLGRSPGEGNGSPPQDSCLENSMDRGAWRATIHGAAKSPTWLDGWVSLSAATCLVLCAQNSLLLRTGTSRCSTWPRGPETSLSETNLESFSLQIWQTLHRAVILSNWFWPCIFLHPNLQARLLLSLPHTLTGNVLMLGHWVCSL